MEDLEGSTFQEVLLAMYATSTAHVFKKNPWAARYNTWLLIKLTPKGVVFSFLFKKKSQTVS